MDEAVQAICWFSAVFVNILFKWIKKMFASFCTHRTEGCGKCAACRQDTSRSCIKLTEREKSSVVSVRLQHRLCDESFSCYFFFFSQIYSFSGSFAIFTYGTTSSLEICISGEWNIVVRACLYVEPHPAGARFAISTQTTIRPSNFNVCVSCARVAAAAAAAAPNSTTDVGCIPHVCALVLQMDFHIVACYGLRAIICSYISARSATQRNVKP